MQEKKINIFTPTPEHHMLRGLVRKFAETEVEPKANERDINEKFDPKLFRRLGELGLLGITASEKYGGSAMDAVAAIIVHEELAASDPGFTLAYLAHSILCVNNIAQSGSTAQKERYLKNLCSGKWIGAMAMSEPAVGTDVLGMSTFAQKENDHYIINGRKMWITNGAIEGNTADVLFLYAKTFHQSDKKSISSFIVQGGQDGYKIGQVLKNKLGMRASTTAEIVFDNCKVNKEQLVGNEGDSLLHMMKNLEIERLTLAAISLGIARRSIAIMNEYAQTRKAFNKSISSFGQIKKYIAESYAKYQACRSYVYNSAYQTHLNSGNSRIDSDAAKLISATAAKEIADNAIQVLGGNGYMGEYIVERLWRDAKLIEIGGGTLEAHHKNISRDLSVNPNVLFDTE